MTYVLTIVLYAGSLMATTTSISGLSEQSCHQHGKAVVEANVSRIKGYYVCTKAQA